MAVVVPVVVWWVLKTPTTTVYRNYYKRTTLSYHLVQSMAYKATTLLPFLLPIGSSVYSSLGL